MMRIAFLILLSAVLISGCGSGSSNASEAISNPQGTNIEYKVVSTGRQGDRLYQSMEVITSIEQYSQLISSVPSLSGDIPTPDFANQNLVFITFPFVCTSADITSFVEEEFTSTITLILENKGGCGSDAGSTRPYTLIETAKSRHPLSVILINNV